MVKVGIFSFKKKLTYTILRPYRRRSTSNLLINQVSGMNNAFLGYAKNLSSTGIFIATVSPKKLGTEMLVFFTMPDSTDKIRCQCKVSWFKPYKTTTDQDSGMGLEFINLDEMSQRKINKWVLEQFEKK